MGRLSGRRFLVIRYRKMGDTLMATPIVRSLVEEGAEVFTVGEKPWERIFSTLPGVQGNLNVSNGNPGYWECIKIGWAARKWKCDAALVLRFSNRAALIAKVAGCSSRVGAVRKNKPVLWRLTKNVFGATQSLPHQVDKYYAVADAAAGFELTRRPTLFQSSAEAVELPEKFLTVHLGNGGSNLSWSPERFANLVSRLKETGWAVAVTGDQKERSSHSEAISCANHDLVGATDLDKLASVFAKSSVVIALDGGGCRLATAVGTPIVNLSIGFNWSTSTVMPWMAPGEVVEPSQRCAQCSPGKCTLTGTTCGDSLPVDQVLAAVKRLTA